MDYETSQSKLEMVASLQSRKESLETKLKVKNEELKALCIQEAELTGVLPPETPLEAGESPPMLRRRVGTVFTYPENLINKLKSKEEESLATLELEYNIQTGIAEAARSLASDSTASKCARRKHRLVYQQSQRRLLELEARLNLLRQASRCPLKQRKKPRPPLETEVDGGGSAEMLNGVNLSPVQEKMYQQTQQQGGKHLSGEVVGVGGHQVVSRYPGSTNLPLHSHNRNHHRQVHTEVPYTPNWAYQQHAHELEKQQRNTAYDLQGNRYKEGNNSWYNTAPTSRYLGVGTKYEEEEREKTVRYRDRFGSLDRRRGGSSSLESMEPELRQSPVHRPYAPTHTHAHSVHAHPPSVLLPNQTYPENSLMRTQSLGMVDHAARKIKEKDWYETSLDAARLPPTPPLPAHTPTLPHIHSHTSGSSTRSSEADPTDQIHMPVTQQLSFDTVVPFESPKNHTVVQAGMWQPYREVTKPFEMADFYKYSTKFRKNPSGAPPVPQHKAVYQPLQPMTCQPLAPPEDEIVTQKDKMAEPGADPSMGDMFSDDALSWYQDRNTPQPRSATLV